MRFLKHGTNYVSTAYTVNTKRALQCVYWQQHLTNKGASKLSKLNQIFLLTSIKKRKSYSINLISDYEEMVIDL